MNIYGGGVLDEPSIASKVKQTKYLKRNFLRRILISRYLMAIEKLLRISGANRVCDVGCGEGFVIAYLQRIFRCRIDGCDIDVNVLEVAKAISTSSFLCAGDIAHLPMRDKSYDVVICNEVLEHLEIVEPALAELRRISSSYCILSIPRCPFYQLSNLLVGANWGHWGDDADHKNRWTRSQFINLVQKYFSISRVTTSYPWMLVLARPLR